MGSSLAALGDAGNLFILAGYHTLNRCKTMRIWRNAVAALAVLAFIALLPAAHAQAAGGAAIASSKAYAAAIAMGLSAIGAGYALGKAGSAASAAVAERPEVASRLLIYLVLGEGLGIYGLLVAILIIFAI